MGDLPAQICMSVAYLPACVAPAAQNPKLKFINTLYLKRWGKDRSLSLCHALKSGLREKEIKITSKEKSGDFERPRETSQKWRYLPSLCCSCTGVRVAFIISGPERRQGI